VKAKRCDHKSRQKRWYCTHRKYGLSDCSTTTTQCAPDRTCISGACLLNDCQVCTDSSECYNGHCDFDSHGDFVSSGSYNLNSVKRCHLSDDKSIGATTCTEYNANEYICLNTTLARKAWPKDNGNENADWGSTEICSVTCNDKTGCVNCLSEESTCTQNGPSCCSGLNCWEGYCCPPGYAWDGEKCQQANHLCALNDSIEWGKSPPQACCSAQFEVNKDYFNNWKDMVKLVD